MSSWAERLARGLDRGIAALAPGLGMRRAHARVALDQLDRIRRYEAAARGRRTAGWTAGGGSANAEIAGGLALLRARSRELVRNNEWAGAAVDSIDSWLIGTGVLPYPLEPDTAEAKRHRTLWEAWAETTACDADGQHDFYGLQGLAVRAIVEAGEVLIRRRWRQATDGLPVPMQLQVLEPDHLDDSRDRDLEGGGFIMQGVQFNAWGQREGYWLYPVHPGEPGNFKRGRFTSSFVPVSNVRHVFRTDRAGQVRGVPWGAPAMLRLRDLGDYEDAQLTRAKIAACFVGFVRPSVETGRAPQLGERTDREGVQRFEPGTLQVLDPGEDVTFGNPPLVEGYADFSGVQLLAVAKAYGVSYEELVGDYRRATFSSARASHLSYKRRLSRWLWRTLKPQLLAPCHAWFLEALELAGTPLSVRVGWTPPKHELLDPGVEIAATRLAVRSGLMSHSEGIRSMGEEPRQVLAELASDMAYLDQLGLKVETDLRAAPVPGSAPEGSGGKGGEAGAEDEDKPKPKPKPRPKPRPKPAKA